MTVSYSVELYDPLGAKRLGTLTRFNRLEYARKVNDLGALNLTIDAADVPPNAFDRNQRLMRDLRLAVMRSVDGGAERLALDTVWFVRGSRRTRAQNSALLEVRAVDAMHLLKRRIIASAAGTAGATKTGATLDNIMKAFVREACGSLAIAARQFPGFTVQADLGAAPSGTKAAAWQNLLLTLQEIAGDAAQQSTPIYLYFDVVSPTVGALEFRTYLNQRGVDRRSMRPVGADYGSLADEATDYDTLDEITFGYAGGQGEGVDRRISGVPDTARTGLSPYNRIEVFADCRNIPDAATLPTEARAAVRAGRPKFSFDGRLVDVPAGRFGVDFNFGDRVRAESDVDAFDCRIDAVKFTIDPSGETIDAKLWSAD